MSDAPAPPRLVRDTRRWHEQFPIDTLKVGESVFVTGLKRSTVSVQASRVGRMYEPRKIFQTHAVTENGVAGVRVWRIE